MDYECHNTREAAEARAAQIAGVAVQSHRPDRPEADEDGNVWIILEHAVEPGDSDARAMRENGFWA